VFTEINFSQLSSIIQSNTNVTAVAGVLQCHISDPDKYVNTWKRTTNPWQRGGDVRLCNPRIMTYPCIPLLHSLTLLAAPPPKESISIKAVVISLPASQVSGFTFITPTSLHV